MAGLMSADEVYQRAEDAASAATSPDEKALHIDYQALKEKFRAALGDRKVALCHINKFLPEGYEDQGRFNLVLLTAGNVVFDIVIGDSQWIGGSAENGYYVKLNDFFDKEGIKMDDFAPACVEDVGVVERVDGERDGTREPHRSGIHSARRPR